MSGEPRVLFLLPFVPRADAAHGGKAVTQLLLRLADRGGVSIACLRTAGEADPDPELTRRCEVVETILRTGDAAPALTTWGERRLRLRSLIKRRPLLVMKTTSLEIETGVVSTAASLQPDVVFAVGEEMAQYLGAVATACPRASRIVLVLDPGGRVEDDLAGSSRGLRRIMHALDARAWDGFAISYGAHADRVVALTKRDEGELLRQGVGAPIVTIPLGIDLSAAPLGGRGEDPPTMLFFGGYRHPPNADAARRLAEDILPRVRGRRPAVKLVLVGPGLSPDDFPDDGVVVAGEVPDVEPYLRRAGVVVLPLRLGGGMRVKTIEALAAGKAVVASPLAVEGIEARDGVELLLAETDDEFAGAVIRLVDDPNERAAFGERARIWAESNLGWERVVDEYERLLRTLTRAPT